jgi:hypothetical protein
MTLEYKHIPLLGFKMTADDSGTLEGHVNVAGILDDGADIVTGYDELDAMLASGFMSVDHTWTVAAGGMVGFITDAKVDDVGLWAQAKFHSTPDAQNARVKASERMEAGKQVGLSIGYAPSGTPIYVYPKDYANELPRYVKAENVQATLAKAAAFNRVRVLRVAVKEFSIVTSPMNKLSEAAAVKSMTDNKEAKTALSVKGIFEDELAERNNSPWALWDVFCCVLYRLLWGAESAIETGMAIDPMPAFEACSAEFVARLREWYVSEISDEMAEENAESLISPAELTMAGLFGPADAKTTVKAQGERVSATLNGWLERLKGIHILGLSRGAKEGRTLGAMTRQQMRDHMDAMKEAMGYCDTVKDSLQKVHDDMSAMVDAAEKPKGEMVPVSLDDPSQALLRILKLRTETSAMMTQ